MMRLKGFKFIRVWVNLRKEFRIQELSVYFCMAFQENIKLYFSPLGMAVVKRRKDGVIMRDLIFLCFSVYFRFFIVNTFKNQF